MSEREGDRRGKNERGGQEEIEGHTILIKTACPHSSRMASQTCAVAGGTGGSLPLAITLFFLSLTALVIAHRPPVPHSLIP